MDDVPTVTALADSIDLAVEESSSAVSNSFNVSSLFTSAPGADGEASHHYEITLNEEAENSLTAIVNGRESSVSLAVDENGVLTGKAGDGTVIFKVSVDDSGIVSLTMTGEGTLKHGNEALSLNGIGVKLTVTDKDGDATSDNISLALSINDGPITFNGYTSNFESHAGSTTDSVTLDFNDYNNKHNNPIENKGWTPSGYENWYKDGSGTVYDHGHEETGYKNIGITQDEHYINLTAVTVSYLDADGETVINQPDNTSNIVPPVPSGIREVFGYDPLLTFVSARAVKNIPYPESGLSVYSGESDGDSGDGEIGGIDGALNTNVSEAVKITLDETAYSITIGLNAFYNETWTPGSDDIEKACVVFLDADGKQVGMYFWDAERYNNGVSDNNTFYIASGFKTAYIIPWGQQSDFLVNSVSVDYNNDPEWTLSGTITASSADRIVDYAIGHMGESITIGNRVVQIRYNTADGTVDFYTVEKNGNTQTVKLLGQASITDDGRWKLDWFDSDISPEGMAIPVISVDGDGDSSTINIIVTGTMGDSISVTGKDDADAISGTAGNDTLLGGSGDDIVYGQGGDDLIFGDGSDTVNSGTPIGTLNTLDNLLPEAGSGTDGSYAERIHALGAPGTQEQPSELDKFISSLEGDGGIEKNTDGNDLLFGGSGDDVIFGMGGNDYIDGGEGSDIIFAGSGNDIIVYDESDYLVDGGSGIDVMIHDGNLSLDDLLDGNTGPIVNDVEVLITGDKALSLTSMDELSKVGITITQGEGGDTLSLGAGWTAVVDTNTTDNVVSYTNATHELTVQIDMDAMSQPETDQMVFILNNANG